MARKNFNSQPHKEADKAEGYAYNDMEHFNSQPHKEADPITYKTRASHYISTHSLTRRLTLLCFAGSRTLMYFNSQPHKEADRDLTKTKEKFETFQLTASQGG